MKRTPSVKLFSTKYLSVKNLAERVLKEHFPEYKLKNERFSIDNYDQRFGMSFRDYSDLTNADSGIFEIHHGKKHLASVYVHNRGIDASSIRRFFSKKPHIFVLNGHEKLGKALSEAFKEHAEYLLKPKISKFKELPDSELITHSIYPLNKKIRETLQDG